MPQDRADLPIGETLDVKLRSAVVVTNTPLVVQMGSGPDAETVTVPTGGAGVVDIEVVSPLNWPPLKGDVWVDGTSNKWFAVEVVESGVTKVKLVPEDGGVPTSYQLVKTEHRPLTLEYRTA
jgi:hypothetical protein